MLQKIIILMMALLPPFVLWLVLRRTQRDMNASRTPWVLLLFVFVLTLGAILFYIAAQDL